MRSSNRRKRNLLGISRMSQLFLVCVIRKLPRYNHELQLSLDFLCWECIVHFVVNHVCMNESLLMFVSLLPLLVVVLFCDSGIQFIERNWLHSRRFQRKTKHTLQSKEVHSPRMSLWSLSISNMIWLAFLKPQKSVWAKITSNRGRNNFSAEFITCTPTRSFTVISRHPISWSTETENSRLLIGDSLEAGTRKWNDLPTRSLRCGTDLQNCYWDVLNTPPRLTCGVSGASWPKCFVDLPSSGEETRQTSWS